ncbi:putative ribonuclease H-like domain-containing protein [Tanacetum coccineum]
MNQFYEIKGIKREFNVARTPQQNGVAERKNKTLIEVARTMLVDSKLPTTFWAEAVNIACYVLNRVLVIEPHNKTPYELIRGRPPLIDFMKPFGCPVTILNTRDHLGKFDGKANEGYFVGYSVVSKAMRVFNKRTRIVEETLNVRFLENIPNVKGNRPDWLFNVDSLTISMNYMPVVAGNQTNGIAGTKDNIVAGQAQKEKDPKQEYILIPLCTTDPLISQGPKDSEGDAEMKLTEVDERGGSDKNEKDAQDTRSESERLNQREMQTEHTNSTNSINTVSTPVSTAGPSFDNVVPSPPVNTAGPSVSTANAFEEHLFERFSPFKNAFTLPPVPNVSSMDNTGIFGNAYDDEDLEEEVDMNNVISSYSVPDTSFTKFHKDHPEDQVIGSLKTPVQTRHMTKINEEHGLFSSVHKLRRTNHKDFQNCLFACFLSQMEPKKPVQALKDPSWVEAMQDELLQFKLLKNKKDERGKVVKNKARLVAQGHTQEEGIDYDEVFAPIARIEAIRLFLAYASFKDFVVFQMDVKSAFLYGKIEEEVFVCQPLGFEDPHFPDKVYKVEKALYGLYQAIRAWYKTLSTYLIGNGFYRGQIDKTLFIKRHKNDILLVQVYVDDIIFGSTKKEMSIEFKNLMHDKFQMISIGELSFFLGLQVQQKSDGIFISQDKYVAEILKKFYFASVKTASTLMETNKALIKDEEAEEVDVHLYRSMIGSLMYLTASRPDIMFVVCACARDSPFDLEAFSKSGYAGASLDRKSTTGGCQFLGKRLILWQCKKQTIVANSTTKAEYVAAANCCRQVGDEVVHKEMGDRMERAATTASSYEAEQDSGSGLSIGVYTAWHELNIASIKLVLLENEEMETTATIDGRVKTITEASIRRHLNLEDSIWYHNAKILSNCSYGFSSNIATDIIFLATNRTFNFSKMIFEGMRKNLIYSQNLDVPRFIQIFLNKHKRHLLPHKRTYVALTLTQKLFSNMRRVSTGYTRVNIPLFPTMLTAPESSSSRITSSPSLSPQTHPSTSQQPPTPPFMQTIHDAEEPATMPHDSSQPRVQSLGSDEGSLTLNELTVLCTTLSKKVKKLEHKVKASKSRRRARVIISDNEEDLEDSYKQGRIIAEIDQNPSISLVQDEGTSWIQEDAETQGRTSADTEILLEQEEPTELVEDPGSGEKGEKEISTAEVLVSTASAIPEVSTAIPERQVYIRRSAEKRKDKGKAIMKDDESVQKKTKKQLEQERLRLGEAIRRQEQINEEERQRIARDAEIAKQLLEEIDIARQE